MNDVREAGAPFRFALEVGFRIARKPACRPATPAWTGDGYKPPYPIYDPNEIPFGFKVLNVPSMTWFGGVMPRGGRMLPGTWTHKHSARHFAMLLVAASVRELNLSCSSFTMVRARIEGVDGHRRDWNMFAQVEDIHSAYHAVVQRAGDRLVCSTKADDSRATASVQIAGTWYDRQGLVDCRPWHFRAGESWTVVAFHSPHWSQAKRHYNMHTIFFFYADIPDAGVEASIGLRLEPLPGWNVCDDDSPSAQQPPTMYCKAVPNNLMNLRPGDERS